MSEAKPTSEKNEEGESAGDNSDRYQLALRASYEGVWDWDLQQDQWFCTELVEKFLDNGKQKSFQLLKNPENFVLAEDLEKFRNSLETALENSDEEFVNLDCRVQDGEGGQRWLRIRGAIIRGSDLKPLRIAGTMIDISRRKEAESKLQEERHLLRMVIDNLPLHLYFKNKESRFTLANEPMAEWMGLGGASEMVGLHDKDFFSKEHWEKAEFDEREIMSTGKPLFKEVEKETWRDEDGGDDTWVMTTKMPWRNSRGEITGIFGVSSDVSQMVKTQQELERVAQELHKRNEVYEEELSLAHEIQLALVDTKSPKIGFGEKQLTFGQRYLPISGLAGDFFDIQKIGDSKVGVFICDVMGHGVRSALIVTMLRGLMEQSSNLSTEPNLYLGKLNEGLSAILNRAKVTMFATACYMVFDLKESKMLYTVAGHPSPIVRRNGEVGTLDISSAKGPALGLIPGVSYPVAEEKLEGLEKILLFTDGIFEAENHSGEAFMLKRLQSVVETCGSDGIEELLDDVIKRVLAFAQAQHFDDDVCLLGIDID